MDTITQTILSQNMRALRKLHGLTQQQVGDLLGVTNTQISRYELGMDFPSAGSIDRLADVFKVFIADLFTSDIAQNKKVEIQGATQADVLRMINKMLADAGLQMATIPKSKKAG